MKKWASMIFLLFFLCLPMIKANGEEETLFSNLLFEETVDVAQCEQMQMEVSAMDSSTSIDEVPELVGQWVSQDCEVRPGPEFLLRNYIFMRNNSFRLQQHFYDDESCMLPLYTVIVKGSLTPKESSWVIPSGTDFDYILTKVTVIPHTTETSEKLFLQNKHKCSHGIKKVWKPHWEYTVYNKHDDGSSVGHTRKKSGRYRKRKAHKSIDCLSAMGLQFNELMLIRSQWRKIEGNKKNKELLLGDIHSRRKQDYKPTAFQVPLLQVENAHNCVNCRLISRSTERAPPHLIAKPQLPPLPYGQWVSGRCEVRPLGMFLTRRLSFDSRSRTWMAEYKYHADPFCTDTVFAISSSGKYQIGPVQNKERIQKKRKSGSHLDLRIEEASLTLYDPTLRDTFNADSDCGIGMWYVGIAKDLSPTNGCSVLGISLPSTEFDLIKLEIDEKGTPLLFLGLQDTDGKKRSHSERPTSYQAPLIQCSVFPQQNIFNNQLEPFSNAKLTSKSSVSCYSSNFLIGVLVVVIYFHFKYI